MRIGATNVSPAVNGSVLIGLDIQKKHLSVSGCKEVALQLQTMVVGLHGLNRVLSSRACHASSSI
jgi:hypothetical protein